MATSHCQAWGREEVKAWQVSASSAGEGGSREGGLNRHYKRIGSLLRGAPKGTAASADGRTYGDCASSTGLGVHVNR
jgi:hypothetical protein